MAGKLPIPSLDALPMGAHRLFVLTDQPLFQAVGVRLAFTGRSGGVSEGGYASLNMAWHVGDDPTRVQRNHEIAMDALGCAGMPLVMPDQGHGTHVVTVSDVSDADRAQEEAVAGADAVVVASPGVAVLINSADCLSTIIVSPTGRFVIAHAGWRGAVAGVAGKAARALAQTDEKAGEAARPEEFNAYIGPHIGPECFEVGEEVSATFSEVFGSEAVPDSRHVSLAGAVSADLVGAGLLRDRIADAGICTKCNPDRYFSYRASDGPTGRHSAIAFREQAPAAGSGSTNNEKR